MRRNVSESRLLAKNKAFLTPTLVTEHALTFIDDVNATPDPRMAYVSAEELKWWKPENGMLTKYRTPAYIAFRKPEYAKILEEIPRAEALGVRFQAGTDITIRRHLEYTENRFRCCGWKAVGSVSTGPIAC